MTAPDPLAPIRARAEAYADHGTPGLHAPKDRAALLAALDAVLALHIGTCEMSGENCAADDCPMMVCGACGEDHPCQTVAAVSAALGGGE